MKYAFLITMSATLALGACSKPAAPAPEASASTDASPAPTALPSPPPSGPLALVAGEAPAHAFIVGTWGEAPDCKMPITFQADGTIKDGPFGRWEIEDGRLTMDGTVSMKLKIVDENTMESLNDGGRAATLKRC